MGILNGVMRFSLAKGSSPHSIFTTVLAVILLGDLILVLFFSCAFHSRALIRIQWNIPRFIFSIAAMVLQCVMIEYGHAVWAYSCAAGVVALPIRPRKRQSEADG